MSTIQSSVTSGPSHDNPWRPQFHFMPPQGWMNDPNGLVYYAGEYHLFYQYYPEDTIWGPMHWGHAVSTDLINWTFLPIALYPDEHGYIYSGSAVIDWQNTAGFGQEAMVAMFTHHNPENSNQSQSLAYSLDKGRTWEKYAVNPVIPRPPNMTDFRDPRVFWYEDGQNGGHWVMALAAGNSILFYTSSNLLDWKSSGSFGDGYGSTAGVWETPDLFPLPLGGGPESRWVLTVGVSDGAPAGGSGMQYFVGQFDGQKFSSEQAKEMVQWADWGADFYAAPSWSDPGSSHYGNGRRIWLAWLNNWRYAASIPESTSRGTMTIPRELSLSQTVDGVRLIQKPVAALKQLRSELNTWSAVTISPAKPFIPDIQGDLLEIVAEFQIKAGADLEQLNIRLRAGDEAVTTIGYRPKNQTLTLDRSQSGSVNFSPDFPNRHSVLMPPIDEKICLHILVDRSSIEMFGNDGSVSMSELIFPNQRPYRLEIFADGGQVMINTLDVYYLEAASFLAV